VLGAPDCTLENPLHVEKTLCTCNLHEIPITRRDWFIFTVNWYKTWQTKGKPYSTTKEKLMSMEEIYEIHL
jgi:hypothetical protein